MTYQEVELLVVFDFVFKKKDCIFTKIKNFTNMFNSLIQLLSDSELENRLWGTLNRCLTPFSGLDSSFDKTEDGYNLVLDVAKDATASNVSVDFDDETHILTVAYNYKNVNSTTSTTIKETLPDDADEETLEATVADGKLTITVKRRVDPVCEDDATPQDPTVVPIRRKK